MTRHTLAALTMTVAIAVSGAACNGGEDGGGTPTNPTPSPGPTPPPGGGGTTITIGSDGRVNPSAITVSTGTQVTFVNNDDVNHDMSSNPHPTHTDCVEINQVGFLAPGQSGQTAALNTARTCGFHDHNQPTDTGLQGTITIQ